MRKYISLFFSVSFFLIACDSMPGDVIKPKQMVAILTGVHIIDGSLMNIPQMPDTLYKYGAGKYMALFKQYNTDSVQFRKSYKYYTLHPDLLTAVYDSVTKRLQFKSDSLTALVAKQNIADAKKNMTPVQGPGNMPGHTLGKPYNTKPVFMPVRAIRHSMLKKHLKTKNALSGKQR